MIVDLNKAVEFTEVDSAFGTDFHGHLNLSATRHLCKVNGNTVGDINVVDAVKNDVRRALWRQLYGEAYEKALAAFTHLLVLRRLLGPDFKSEELNQALSSLSASVSLMTFDEARPPVRNRNANGKPFVPVSTVFGCVSAHDWPGDFTMENGRYQNRCIDCATVFYGRRGRTLCRVCVRDTAKNTAVLMCDGANQPKGE